MLLRCARARGHTAYGNSERWIRFALFGHHKTLMNSEQAILLFLLFVAVFVLPLFHSIKSEFHCTVSSTHFATTAQSIIFPKTPKIDAKDDDDENIVYVIFARHNHSVMRCSCSSQSIKSNSNERITFSYYTLYGPYGYTSFINNGRLCLHKTTAEHTHTFFIKWNFYIIGQRTILNWCANERRMQNVNVVYWTLCVMPIHSTFDHVSYVCYYYELREPRSHDSYTHSTDYYDFVCSKSRIPIKFYSLFATNGFIQKVARDQMNEFTKIFH